jgi:hypothetical protein
MNYPHIWYQILANHCASSLILSVLVLEGQGHDSPLKLTWGESQAFLKQLFPDARNLVGW